MQHFCRNFLGFECFFNNPNWNRNIFSDFLLDFTQKFQKWPFSVNRGFWIRFRFGSVFEKSVIFGFGSVRVLEFSVGFSVFRVTDQPLLFYKNGQSVKAAGGFLAPNFKMKLLMNFSSISNVFYSLLDPQFCKKNPIWPLWPPFFTGDLYLLKIAQNSKNWKKNQLKFW